MTTRRSNIRNFILWAELQRLSKERLRECEQATLRYLFDLFQTGNFEVPLALGERPTSFCNPVARCPTLDETERGGASSWRRPRVCIPVVGGGGASLHSLRDAHGQ